MQTTLLGLAIALILALFAALVGPYFVDWNQFRPQFEAEASRVVGAPVRVTGKLDALLLPTPTLRLYGVAVGEKGAPWVSAGKLDVIPPIPTSPVDPLITIRFVVAPNESAVDCR